MEQKMIYVGIDWADEHHDIVITDDSAKTLDLFRIDHTPDGFALLHSHIANHQAFPGLVLVAIETSRGLLVHELLQKGYTVYAINPKAVNRYKDRNLLFKAFPDHDTLSACTKKAFLAFLKKHRYPCTAKAEELWKTIQSPTLQPDKAVARSGRLRLGMLLDQLENLKEHITHYEQEIQAILDKLPE